MNPIVLIRNFFSRDRIIPFINCDIAHFVELSVIKSKIRWNVFRCLAAIIAFVNLTFLNHFIFKFITAFNANHFLSPIIFKNCIGAAKKFRNDIPVFWFNLFIKKESINSFLEFFSIKIHVFINKVIKKVYIGFFEFLKSLSKKRMINCNFKRIYSIHAPILMQNVKIVN